MNILRRNAARILALAVVLILYGFTQLPQPSQSERQALAENFYFTQLPLAEHWSDYGQKNIRQVNPNLDHIAGWISSVGASVALNDLDGDGFANDLCRVEPRIDQVIVTPVPNTGARYVPMILSPKPLPFDDATTAPMGCLPGDLNEDGQMDLLVYYWGRTPIAFLRHENGYRPQEITTELERWYSNSATLADLDGDGHMDLVIANYFQDGARILDANAQDSDAMQHSMSRAYNGGSTRFFLSEQTTSGVRFREVTGVVEESVNYAWTLAVGAADLDGDLLPELYFANDFGPDRLLHNRSLPGQLRFALLEGERRFTTPASKVLGKDSFKGMGIDFADLNGDGWLDLFVSNIAAQFALEESHFAFISTGQIQPMKKGIAPYIDRSELLGLSRSDWSWDAKFADFDNNGVFELIQATGFVKGTIDRWPELHELAMGNDELLSDARAWPLFRAGDDLSGYVSNPFYTRGTNERFVDISAELGLNQPQVTRGIAIADVDGDGDLDFALANQWEASHFYRNDCRHCGQFLGLNLRLPIRGTESQVFKVQSGHPAAWGHPAIGASAHVTLPDGRVMHAQVDGGNGHSGKRNPALHFGLGDVSSTAELSVRLRWRDADGQVRHHRLSLQPGWYTVQLGTPTDVSQKLAALSQEEQSKGDSL